MYIINVKLLPRIDYILKTTLFYLADQVGAKSCYLCASDIGHNYTLKTGFFLFLTYYAD
jgi:hypothetical protein